MNTSKQWIQTGIAAMVVCLGAGFSGAATAYTWTNTPPGFLGNWSDGANWNPATGTPGDAAGDSAYLTQSAAGAYTNSLNSTLANSLSVLAISNTLGEARLIITNNTLATATLTLGNGSQLQLDNGAVLNNTSTFNWTGTTNSAIILNNGGTLTTPAAALYLGNNEPGIVGLVTSASGAGQGGQWNLGGQALNIGAGTSVGAALTVANGAVVTNLGISLGTSYTSVSNSLIITNGGMVYAKSTGLFQINGSRNSIVVGGGDQTSVLNMGGSTVGGQSEIWLGQSHNGVMSHNAFTIDVNGVVTNVTGTKGFCVGFTQGNDSTNNSLIVKNGGRLYASSLNVGSFRLNGSMFTHGNTALISNGTVNLTDVVFVGAFGEGNQLTVNNGGQLNSGVNVGANSIIGGAGNNGNYVTVEGIGSVWNLGTRSLYFSGNATGNVLTVVNGGMVTNALAITPHNGSSSMYNDSIVITNGGKVYMTGGYQPNGSGNSALVGGGSQVSVWNLGDIMLPQAAYGFSSNNTFIIDANAIVSNAAGTFGVCIGFEQGFGALNNTLTVRNGGQLWAKNLTFGRLYSGTVGSSGNTMLITAGGAVTVDAAGGVTVGQSSYSTSNTLLVTAGGILEANTLTVGNYTDNILTNNGGVFQFTSSSPTLTPGSFGRIGIHNGTVSFRAVTTANVLCNRGSQPLDATSKVAWFGANTFCLNSASNNTTGQAYTFTDSAGSTNFASLKLLNGSLYQGGNVTIGTNGTLLVSNGVSTINGELSFVSNANAALSIDVSSASYLVATNLTLNGCALNLTLGPAPVVNTPLMIISNTSAGVISGQFSNGNRWVSTVNGTNYVLTLNTASGSGVVLTTRLQTLGTSLIIE